MPASTTGATAAAAAGSAHGAGVLQALGRARSFLFVPADRPERHAKALAAGADAVIIDLEDAVAPAAKAGAALALRTHWAAMAATPGRPLLLLRCNAPGTPWHVDDLALAALLRPDGLVLPKAESPAQLAQVAQVLAYAPAPAGGPAAAVPGHEAACDVGPVAVLPLIESAAGLAAVRAIATCGLAQRLLLGHLDLQADLGLQCGDDERELDSVRLELVLASRLGGLPAPVDGVTVATGDALRLAADTQRAQRFGFSGKLCIHPQQVAGVHAALRPSAQRLDWARRVLDAVQAAAHGSAGQGAVQLDGKMVDAPVILLARQLLAAARD